MASNAEQGICPKRFLGGSGGLTLQVVIETLGTGVTLANVQLTLSCRGFFFFSYKIYLLKTWFSGRPGFSIIQHMLKKAINVLIG